MKDTSLGRLPSVPQTTTEASASSGASEQRMLMRPRSVGLLAGNWRDKPWLQQSLSVALGPAVFRWAAGSGIWNSQDTDVPATLGSQPGLLLSLIPIFGCRSRLIHIPMSTLHNLPQTLTATELGKGKGQLMSGGRETQGERKRKLSGKPPKAPSCPPPGPPAGPLGPTICPSPYSPERQDCGPGGTQHPRMYLVPQHVPQSSCAQRRGTRAPPHCQAGLTSLHCPTPMPPRSGPGGGGNRAL